MIEKTSIADLVADLQKYNAAYRSGHPLIEDSAYDRLVEALRRRDPHHPYLQRVEPEQFAAKAQVRHPLPMLSTEKAYAPADLQRFVDRVHKEAEAIGVAPVVFKVTPKLDGLAGRDDGRVFASRGNGEVGYEISSAFAKGVVPEGGRGQGLGEIVIRSAYFEGHLAGAFEHPRNLVVGIVASDTVNPLAQQALDDGAVRFVPYATLPTWTGGGAELVAGIERIVADLTEQVEYPLDGVVVEVVDESLKAHMGATSHHYRWQIAFKSRGETAVTVVTGLQWQVGRTGSVTPVMEVEPVSLSGATIRRVTAHNAGLVRKAGIGPGAEIEIIRSGEVIPKLEAVIVPALEVALPERCPACDTPLEWSNDFLKCTRFDCRAQIEQRLHHWFKTLGTADWFGIKTIEKLTAAGYDSLEKLYAMRQEDFAALTFGPVQSRNLAEALTLSRTRPVEDWRFLAAFGIPDLGKGDSRRLLVHVPLEALPETPAETIGAISGFGPVTSRSIADGVARAGATLRHMLDLGFNLRRTARAGDAAPGGPLSGKGVVFTGTMVHGTREALQADARAQGAVVQTAVSGKTDYLVCGQKVGQRKLEKAAALGVTVLSEAEYLELIGGPSA